MRLLHCDRCKYQVELVNDEDSRYPRGWANPRGWAKLTMEVGMSGGPPDRRTWDVCYRCVTDVDQFMETKPVPIPNPLPIPEPPAPETEYVAAMRSPDPSDPDKDDISF